MEGRRGLAGLLPLLTSLAAAAAVSVDPDLGSQLDYPDLPLRPETEEIFVAADSRVNRLAHLLVSKATMPHYKLTWLTKSI